MGDASEDRDRSASWPGAAGEQVQGTLLEDGCMGKSQSLSLPQLLREQCQCINQDRKAEGGLACGTAIILTAFTCYGFVSSSVLEEILLFLRIKWSMGVFLMYRLEGQASGHKAQAGLGGIKPILLD